MVKIFLLLILTSLTALASPSNLEKADYFLQQGLPAESRKLAEQELTAHPESLKAKILIVKAALAQQDLDTAHRYSEDLLKAEPTNSDYLSLLGTILILQKQASAAVPYLEKALEYGQADKKTPEQMSLYAESLITALHQTGQKQVALKRCQEFIQLYPANGNLYLSASRLYRESADYQNALAVAQRGLQVAPQAYNLYASQALAHAGLGHKELAEKDLQILQKHDPELAKVIRNIIDGQRTDSAEFKVEIK